MDASLNPRIHRALDGELLKDALTPEEALELLTVEACIDGALRSVPRESMPDLAPAILARLDRLPAPALADASVVQERSRRASRDPGGWRALVDWLWRPRPIELAWRPAYGCGVAVLALLLGGAILAREGGTVSAGAPETPATGQVLVQFRLDAPNARAVTLAGDFTNWQPTYVLRRTAPGVWTVVAPLAPGIHDYAFVIDGEHWVPDPMAPAVDDGFGGLNSRVAVMTPDSTGQSL